MENWIVTRAMKGDSVVGRGGACLMPGGCMSQKQTDTGEGWGGGRRKLEQVKREGHGNRSRKKSCEAGHTEC